MAGPMSAVLDALREGCVSREEIARRTSLSPMTIDAVMAHLETTGDVQRRALNDSCAGGCGGCSSRGACSIQQGPVALVLGRR